MIIPGTSLLFTLVKLFPIVSSLGVVYELLSFTRYRGFRKHHSRNLILIGILYFISTNLLGHVLSAPSQLLQVQRYLMAYTLTSTIFGMLYYFGKEIVRIRTYASEYMFILIGLGMTTYLYLDSINDVWSVIKFLIFPYITGYTIFAIVGFFKYQHLLSIKIHFPIDVIFLKGMRIFHSIFILYVLSSVLLFGLIPLENGFFIIYLLLSSLNLVIFAYLHKKLLQGKQLIIVNGLKGGKK